MDPIDQLLGWAESEGIVLNGITPKVIPGRGLGLVSTRRIETNETILKVPSPVLRTLDNTPKSITAALHGATVHAILAASLAFDLSSSSSSSSHPPPPDFSIWKAVFPTPLDISTSMPLCWPSSLQSLLPHTAQSVLSKQRAKFEKDWAVVEASSLPEHHHHPLSKDDFLYAWLLVNTRTFYHTTPATRKALPKEDHMVLQPVADLFNHSPHGCTVAFTPAGFSITSTGVYDSGDEVFIRYGSHSNDFLLVEYGFTLPLSENSFDEVCLDPYLCSLFTPLQQSMLEGRGFWGRYMLDAQTACYRTQIALRLLVLTEEQWQDVLDGERDEDLDQARVNRELLKVLHAYSQDIQDYKSRINDASVGDVMRNSLRDRWEQIAELVDRAIARITA